MMGEPISVTHDPRDGAAIHEAEAIIGVLLRNPIEPKSTMGVVNVLLLALALIITNRAVESELSDAELLETVIKGLRQYVDVAQSGLLDAAEGSA